jgi:mono/diheme cytochrome c family protein
MKHVKTRGASVTGMIAFALFICCVVSAAFGQRHAMRIQIPYAFTVGADSKVLPAGSYTFSAARNVLDVESDVGSLTGMIITQLSGPGNFLEAGSLVFDTTGGAHILSEVWIPGTDGQLMYVIPKGHTHDVLLASYLSTTHAVSGKSAYIQTCGRCHGAEGKGNKNADKFFNTTIPRLNTAAVQAKTDAELKNLINNGSSVMPPVEIEESGFKHRLPPQDVDAVIAYVRTLKQ